jgi:DNA-binding MarR family transcriptional regulator
MMPGRKKKAANPLPLNDVDRVIHEPARLNIVAVLQALEHADFLFLERETGLTRGNLSSHLTKLEHAGYIVIEKTFVEKIPRTVVALTEDGRAAFNRYRKTLLRALG